MRAARQSRNLSIEQAERDTRIRARYLVGIEKGDLSEIPSRVQARGFLYNYSQYLGIEPDSVIANYDAIYGTQAQPVPSAAPTVAHAPYQQPQSQPQPPQPVVPNPQPSRYAPQNIRPVATPHPDVPQENGISAPVESSLARRLLSSDLFLLSILALIAVLVLGVGSRVLRNVPSSEGGGGQSAFLESFDSGPSGTITATFAPTSTSTATPPLLAQDRVRVAFEVVQRNWMRIEVDGEVVFEGLAEPGTILQYEGLDAVRVTTGNGAGIKVTYNGIDIGPLGQRGFLAEQIYTVGGLETLTPTPTTTNTPIPTVTPAVTATNTPVGTATDTPEP